MISSTLAIVTMSLVAFWGLKIMLWGNLVVFLPGIGREVPRTFWTWTPLEVVLSGVASVSFSSAIILEVDGWTLAAPFMVSSLSWFAYMIRRVWRTSKPRRS